MKIKIAIGALLLVVVLVVAITLLTGGDDEDDEPTTAQEGSGGGDDDDDGNGDDEDAAPLLKTLDVKRAEGKSAVVAPAGFTEKPKEFWLRVSAAPKQKVKGSWNVSCAGGGTDMDTFEVTPPHLMQLRVPTKNARSCVAGASAQLSGEGRLKVSRPARPLTGAPRPRRGRRAYRARIARS